MTVAKKAAPYRAYPLNPANEDERMEYEDLLFELGVHTVPQRMSLHELKNMYNVLIEEKKRVNKRIKNAELLNESEFILIKPKMRVQ